MGTLAGRGRYDDTPLPALEFTQEDVAERRSEHWAGHVKEVVRVRWSVQQSSHLMEKLDAMPKQSRIAIAPS